MDDRVGAAVARHVQLGPRTRCEPVRWRAALAHRVELPDPVAVLSFQEQATLHARCEEELIRTGERAHDPFIWTTDTGDPGSDATNTLIQAGVIAAAVAISPDPAVPFCETGEQTDPPHTCPAKAGEEQKPAENPR